MSVLPSPCDLPDVLTPSAGTGEASGQADLEPGRYCHSTYCGRVQSSTSYGGGVIACSFRPVGWGKNLCLDCLFAFRLQMDTGKDVVLFCYPLPQL